ncbi:hypothetical protein POPTR_015G119201v4 [Populus trichocarpa]|uniref:Uncharacterized protein n=1 Tax=Populus trichocarpa TaxID=3694 RepID=A0ACC0RW58_POPTR|nr:hypothetical protein BDE02_15G102100 [Populus trichocarpa]KAI9381515.1 hypothetical protein POPTR_015G119201v4 [Populus trichocarpa]
MMALLPFLTASNPNPNPLFLGAFVGVEMEGMKVEEAYFRGRNLQGARFPIPNGCSGNYVILQGIEI